MGRCLLQPWSFPGKFVQAAAELFQRFWKRGFGSHAPGDSLASLRVASRNCRGVRRKDSKRMCRNTNNSLETRFMASEAGDATKLRGSTAPVVVSHVSEALRHSQSVGRPATKIRM
jgi:hypothetical protein